MVKIAIMTDADVDGMCIRELLYNLFYLWGTTLFDENRIFVVQTPLFSAKKGNDLKLFYSFEEYHKQESKIKGYEITYFKGLGTMPLDVYDECINKPKLIPITMKSLEDETYLKMAFGNSSELRQQWLLNKFVA